MFKIDRESKTPIYIQIYDSIVDEIINGYLIANEALPSRRALCRELNISPVTVENAYGKLVSDGYVVSRPGSGYYVSSDRVWDDERKVLTDNVFNFSSNGVEVSKLPFAKWSKLMLKTIKEDTGLFQHGEKHGEYCLRKSIRRLLFRTQGIQCKTEHIVIGPGLEDLMREIFLLLAYKTPVLMNNYYNYRIKSVANVLHLDPDFIENDSNGIDIAKLMKYETGILYQKPTHDLPTGVTLSNEKRGQLVKWPGDGRYIIEDTSENDYCYSKRKRTLWELSGGKNVILLGSFSNTIAPSMKIGYAVLPEQILKLWAASKTFYANRVSRAEQVTLSKFIDLGYYEQHVGYMRSIYREKLNTLKTAFSESELSAHTKLSGDEAGMFCLAEFDIDADERESSRLLLSAGIKASLLNSSIGIPSLARYPENAYVIGFGELKNSQINDGIKRWSKAWKSYL